MACAREKSCYFPRRCSSTPITGLEAEKRGMQTPRPQHSIWFLSSKRSVPWLLQRYAKQHFFGVHCPTCHHFRKQRLMPITSKQNHSKQLHVLIIAHVLQSEGAALPPSHRSAVCRIKCNAKQFVACGFAVVRRFFLHSTQAKEPPSSSTTS